MADDRPMTAAAGKTRRTFTPPIERIENAAMALAHIVARSHSKGWLVDPPPEVEAAIRAFREANERTSCRKQVTVAEPIDTDAIRDEIATTTDPWQWRAWVEDLLPEVDRMRAENAALDADLASLEKWAAEH